MLMILAIFICVYAGWRRFAWYEWLLPTVVLGTIVAIGYIWGGHHEGAGPLLETKIVIAVLQWCLLPSLAYGLGWGARSLKRS
jgi:hypothetical protein